MHVLSILSLASLALAAPSLTMRAEPAPLLVPRESSNTMVLPDKYIVKMKERAEVSKASAMYKAAHTYKSGGFKGFAATLSKEQLEAVRNDPNVSITDPRHVIFFSLSIFFFGTRFMV